MTLSKSELIPKTSRCLDRSIDEMRLHVWSEFDLLGLCYPELAAHAYSGSFITMTFVLVVCVHLLLQPVLIIFEDFGQLGQLPPVGRSSR